MKKKLSFTVIALVLSLVCTVSVTVAWLMDKTPTVSNTFTVGDVTITLTESRLNADGSYGTPAEGVSNTYKAIPGTEYKKDPKVTVEGGSEACYLFVVIEKSTNFDTYMTYDIADGWTELAGYPGVYYRKVDAVAEDATAEYPVLLNNQVVVSQDVTADQLEEAESNKPMLSFIALAVQQANIADEQAAWSIIENSFNPLG
jgi:hypothetical protein